MMLWPQAVSCPYCGESFDTEIDLSGGSQHYVEDCQVCCRPIEVDVIVGGDGQLESLVLRRDDE